MAGYREFQTGEVLTAANVNDFLMEQSVMKFADAAARDTALGTAVGGANALREGMVAYLDSTDEVLAYNGTAWATVGNAGIGTNVVSNVVTASFTTTSATFVNTNITATITPTSASSKVLVLVSIGGLLSQTANKDAFLALYRGDVTGTQLGDEFAYLLINVANVYVPTAFVYLDSPATTSAQEYRVALRTVAGGPTVATTGEQVITLIEVAA